MLKIGENIHIIAPSVKEALKERDGGFFVDLARKQKEAGADVIDLNIGPRKKDGPEVVEWLVECMQEAVPGIGGPTQSSTAPPPRRNVWSRFHHWRQNTTPN
jgi:cobalamin-dependent methionine synthase I